MIGNDEEIFQPALLTKRITIEMILVDKFIQNTNYEKYLLITPQNWNDNMKIIMEILNTRSSDLI